MVQKRAYEAAEAEARWKLLVDVAKKQAAEDLIEQDDKAKQAKERI